MPWLLAFSALDLIVAMNSKMFFRKATRAYQNCRFSVWVSKMTMMQGISFRGYSL
jgi:hypothetical protein